MKRNILLIAFTVFICAFVVCGWIVVSSNVKAQQIAKQTQQEKQEEYNNIHETKVEVEQIPITPVQPTKEIKPDTNYVQTLTKESGVFNYNGLRETWYSSRVARHYRINEWKLDDNGFWRSYVNGKWYFVIAYTTSIDIGTVINISMGPAIVYDHCPTNGTIDVYTNW